MAPVSPGEANTVYVVVYTAGLTRLSAFQFSTLGDYRPVLLLLTPQTVESSCRPTQRRPRVVVQQTLWRVGLIAAKNENYDRNSSLLRDLRWLHTVTAGYAPKRSPISALDIALTGHLDQRASPTPPGQ